MSRFILGAIVGAAFASSLPQVLRQPLAALAPILTEGAHALFGVVLHVIQSAR